MDKPPETPSAPDREASLDLAQVLAEELELLHGTKVDGLEPPDRSQANERRRLKKVIATIHSGPARAALCLSGGGIRSATFSLGVLQGLAVNRHLERFTYLSTVSGGGYIGSWLTAWTHRQKGSAKSVSDELAAAVVRVEDEAQPINMLRSYSNYLTPQLGLLSADTWTLVATVIRNLVLNWCVIVPPVAIVLLLPVFWREILKIPQPDWGPGWSIALLALGVALLVLPIAYISRDLPSCLPAGDKRGRSQSEYIKRSLLPLVGSAAAIATAWTLSGLQNGHPRLEYFALFGVGVHFLGWVIGWARSLRTPGQSATDRGLRAIVREIGRILVVGALSGSALWLLLPMRVVATDPAYLVLAVPVLLTLYQLGTTLYVGIASKETTEEDREWYARAGAWILIATIAWLAVWAAGLYGPAVVEWILGLRVAIQASLFTMSSVSGIVTWIAGRSAATPAATSPDGSAAKHSSTLQWALAIAAPLFVVSLVLLIGFLANLVLARLVVSLQCGELCGVTGLLLVLALVAGVASYYVNVNRFSLHAMYRNRLVRAYLGATRYANDGKRPASSFTGFDEADNLRMHELAEVRPFHIVNIALNLVRGRRLAWQHRKAASFTVSPLHCGSCAKDKDGLDLGYRRADGYGSQGSTSSENGISLGTALAISGAAVSPNMGYHSSPVVGLLLTAFNGRMGWWLANPGRAGEGRWGMDGPGFAFRPLMAEAFGLTDDTNPYVYLSDGGHFENLGIYEMVQRRCRTILLVDGGCDKDGIFEDLGNALRKIRVDLGIEIEWSDGVTPGTCKSHRCYVATIFYSRCDGVDEAKNGRLVVLKPAVAKADPVDVGTYKRLHDDFPHESTSDQWFDEEQFESYRRLGLVTCELFKKEIGEAFC